MRLHPDKTLIVYGKEALLGWLLSGDACKLAGSSAQGLARSPAGYAWQEPMLARFVRKLSAFSRVIAFDKRGMCLSDHDSARATPTLDERMADIDAVMTVAHSRRSALLA